MTGTSFSSLLGIVEAERSGSSSSLVLLDSSSETFSILRFDDCFGADAKRVPFLHNNHNLSNYKNTIEPTLQKRGVTSRPN